MVTKVGVVAVEIEWIYRFVTNKLISITNKLISITYYFCFYTPCFSSRSPYSLPSVLHYPSQLISLSILIFFKSVFAAID